MALENYRTKRDFRRTPEPQGGPTLSRDLRRFVVQKHAASRLHYDFRLELNGVLKSWAVPKGPSLDPAARSLAVHVEDHPVEYADFEGIIPEGEYGGGTVMLWDRGTWTAEGDPERGYRRGKMRFELHGEKLKGSWTLVRMTGKSSEGGKNWLLIKRDDPHAVAEEDVDVRTERPGSVASGRSLDEIAEAGERVWTAEGEAPLEPGDLDGARRAPMPATLAPELATLVDRPPSGDDWLHEIKLDGYRVGARLGEGGLRLLTRRGNDWTDRFRGIADTVSRLPVESALLDGEVVVLKSDGTTDFQALQNAVGGGGDVEMIYFVFDLPYLDGFDLSRSPLRERKELLRQLLTRVPDSRLRFSDHITGRGAQVFEEACASGTEGIIAKRRESPYRSKRTKDWLKVKCLERQEFVIGGFTQPGGSRTRFGALLLGVHDERGRLAYCGKVGTGFTQRSLDEIGDELEKRERESSPFEAGSSEPDPRRACWVEPELIAEVAFTEWTGDGRLRHPVFQGLRQDKEPSEVTREKATPAPAEPTSGRRSSDRSGDPAAVEGVRLTNPTRVLYPEQGLTKQDLVDYYVAVADRVLPWVTGRPLTLVRCPRGREEKCFYQKHFNESVPDQVGSVDIEESEEVRQYLTIRDLPGLIALVQLGSLELHPWGSRNDRLDRPDQIIFDLDPGEGVDFDTVMEAARQLREVLEALGLESFVRTTGGKGLHVVSPIVRRSTWDEVKQFARDISEAMARTAPDRFLSVSTKAKRKGRIYVDYLRNGRGATAVACYSTRARPGAPVATPIEWSELEEGLDPARFNVETVPDRLARLSDDPWTRFGEVSQSLTKAARENAARI